MSTPTSTLAAPRTNADGPPHPRTQHPAPADDGTHQLLVTGFWTLFVGLAAALAIRVLFGGIGIHGPHTNGGWLSLILALMCLPFGTMLLLLGGAKYLRNRRLERR